MNIEKQLTNPVLTEAASYFHDARKSIYKGAELLYKIDKENLWEGAYSSFTEYVEQECQISRGMASKLVQSWKYYVIDGCVSPKKLEGVDAEKLYLASKLQEGDVLDRIVRAKEWSRQELREELSTVNGEECGHPEESRVTICGKCGKRVS